EARRCRAVTSADEAVAGVKALLGQERRGAHLSGLMRSLSMAAEGYLSRPALGVAQYSGTAGADGGGVIRSAGGRGAARTAEAVYRRGAAILDGALKIGNKAEPIEPDVVIRRMDTVRQSAMSERRIAMVE